MQFFAALTALLLTMALSLVEGRICHDYFVDVNCVGENFNFGLNAPETDIQTSDFILNLVRQGHAYPRELIGTPTTVPFNGPMKLAITFCYPDTTGPSGKLLILTHGIGFDRAYWDLPYDGGAYSFITNMVNAYGYSTLSYDRIGTGASVKGDPVNGVQAGLQVAALTSLTTLARTPGGIPSVEFPGISFQKIVHVGHSFGAALSYTAAMTNPSISNGLVLTGFSQNHSFIHETALAAAFVAAPTVPSLASFGPGYMGVGTVAGVQQWMFGYAAFDPDVLQATYNTIQPATIGELLTCVAGSTNPSTFAGPVMVITGERDLPFCGGDCFATGGSPGTSILDYTKVMMPKASIVLPVVVPAAGHALNVASNYIWTYQKIGEFIQTYVP